MRGCEANMLFKISFVTHICFLFFITALNYCLELIWIYYYIIQSMANLLLLSNTFMSSYILFLAPYIVLPSAKYES